MPKAKAAKPTRKPAAKPTAHAPAKKSPAGFILTVPPLKKGELYAGILIKDGKPAHHLILLAGDVSMKWADAIAWAKKQGGELPTRKEQALLFANVAEAFEPRWYWSSEVPPGYADYAFIQHFADGTQGYGHKDDACRARAVRRVSI